ncbi:hypothetical protein FB45DRAFT_924211 [Roridomyces roridus]|uniref:DUF6533 domain-containing protein n=1 Tax=Roridomyces roridus TaxID=1738132 RepID=A0AAD7FHR2_9AGAR|nr:hypothetical protein FB45DRAFT_924211 [Roridomyces roridus]
MSSAVDLQHQINSNYYINLVSFTLLYYDYFLTLGAEVERYWWNGWSWPTILFFLNRYVNVFGTILVAFQYFWTTESTPHKIQICSSLHSYHQYFAIVTQVIVGLMLILRTYALYERDKRILTFLLLLTLAVIGVGVWAVVAGPSSSSDEIIPTLHQYIGCSSSVTKSQALGLVAAWGGMGVFDCAIFFLTLYRGLSRRQGSGFDMLNVLIRDGAIYFAMIVLCNLGNILTFVLSPPYVRGMPTSFTNAVSSIMISRLMLNLRDPALLTSKGRFTGSTLTTSRGTDRGVGVFSTYLTRGGTTGSGGRTTQWDEDWDVDADDIELRDRDRGYRS